MCERWKTSDYHRPVSPPASCDWRLSLIIGNEKRTSHFLTFLTGSMRNLGTVIKPRKVSPLCWVCPRFCSAMIPRSCMVFATVSGLPGRGRKRARSARSMMLAKKLWNLGASRQQVWQYNHVITIHLARMAAKVWNHRRLCLFWFFSQLTFSLVQANKILWLDLYRSLPHWLPNTEIAWICCVPLKGLPGWIFAFLETMPRAVSKRALPGKVNWWDQHQHVICFSPQSKRLVKASLSTGQVCQSA